MDHAGNPQPGDERPFSGNAIHLSRRRSSLFPKLLGTYEKELWSEVEEAIARKPQLVVDIGAAEGDYTIGLGRRLPDARIVCFEAQESLHFLLRELAGLNDVSERLEVHGLGTADLLNQSLGSSSGAALVVCDVEGAEEELLNPLAVPGLRRADILVELHDMAVPGVSGRIRERFEATHTITQITSRPRVVKDWPLSSQVTRRRKRAYLSEHRPIMDWFWMQAKERA